MQIKIKSTVNIWVTLVGGIVCEHITKHNYQNPGIAVCDALINAGFTDQLLLPNNDAYEESVSSYFSLNARLRPWCILQPHSTQDVSRAMKALYGADKDGEVGGLAIRSGGHSSAYAASGIVNGVTMDLSLMHHTTYDHSARIASIGPGARWKNVYAALSPYNVTVAGGRDGSVGVGGLLLGGGISYYAALKGFSCDSVANFEVVLANGTIINANQIHHPELWKALKGGTNNFGVVTRFDMETSSGRRIAYSERSISISHSDTYVDALVRFTANNKNAPLDAIIGFYTHVPQSPETLIILIEVNVAGRANSTSFDQLNQIPANVTISKHETLAEAASASEYPGNTLSVGSTLTFKNDARIIRRGVELHEEYVSFLTDQIGSANFTTVCFFEPIPSTVEQHSREKGGNMLGLPQDEDLIVWDAGVSVITGVADLAIAHDALMTWTAKLRKYAKSVQGLVDLQYGNYADASQNVIRTYPADNVRLMEGVSEAYDPSGFFQRKVPGGFKLA